jgi:hypothetical protein
VTIRAPVRKPCATPRSRLRYSVCAIAVVLALEAQLRMTTVEPGRRVLTVPAARAAVIAALIVRALPAPVA